MALVGRQEAVLEENWRGLRRALRPESDVMEPDKLVNRIEADSRWKEGTVVSVIGGRLGGNYANWYSRGSESRTWHRVADAGGEKKTPSCC